MAHPPSTILIFMIGGEKTGPVSGPPPQVSEETTSAILGAAKSDPLGQHSGGQDGGDKGADKKIKSEKERTSPRNPEHHA